MLADLAIIPIAHSPHTSHILADILKTIKESGLPYQLTPTSTCIEGNPGGSPECQAETYRKYAV